MKYGRCQAAVYIAETDLHAQSRRFTSLDEAQGWLNTILDRYEFPDIAVLKSPSGWSNYNHETRVIWLASPFKATVVCHELAHFMSIGTEPAHGVQFARCFLQLIRSEIGFFQYADLYHELLLSGVLS